MAEFGKGFFEEVLGFGADPVRDFLGQRQQGADDLGLVANSAQFGLPFMSPGAAPTANFYAPFQISGGSPMGLRRHLAALEKAKKEGKPVTDVKPPTAPLARKRWEAGQEAKRKAEASKPANGHTGSASSTTQTRATPYLAIINQIAREEGVPAHYIAALIDTENSDPNSISQAGARGLMQVVPGQGYDMPGEDWRDPAVSIRQGARALKDKYRATGNWDSAVGAYFGYGTDVGGMTTGRYTETFQNHLRNYRIGPDQTVESAHSANDGHNHGGGSGETYSVGFGYGKPYSGGGITGDSGRTITHHQGVDLVRPGKPNNGRGEAVTPFVSGTVKTVGRAGVAGNYVVITDAQGNDHWYMHLDQATAKQGQQVGPGTPIGILGGTGTEEWPHLHYEIRKPDGSRVDPTPYVRLQQ